jgi:hypothetical protein
MPPAHSPTPANDAQPANVASPPAASLAPQRLAPELGGCGRLQRAECYAIIVSPGTDASFPYGPLAVRDLSALADFAMITCGSRRSMTEPIICPLWEANDKRFRSRQYHAWDRRCCLCGRTVIVTDAVKLQLDSNSQTVILCEQCALIRERESKTEATDEPQSNATEDVGPCATCEVMKEKADSAARELARCADLPDGLVAEAARRKSEHLSSAWRKHRFKAHNSDLRGRV